MGEPIDGDMAESAKDSAAPAAGSRAWVGARERLITLLVFFPVVIAVSMLPLRPPAVVGRDAPPAEFSATRAMAHVEAIAGAPRPMGSPEHARVRDYLVIQIEAQGLDAEVQADTEDPQLSLYNVLTRMQGKSRGPALLLVAHYDTVFGSPGASDNGAGVAALLETLRALRAGPELENDVIFLFSDGEERMLLGAKAFQRHHRWAADVALVLNFEARGARGPSIMFETGPSTGSLIDWFASFAPRPLAYSYSDDVYRKLPNDTDFSVFKRAGRPGFNFAFIGDLEAYHSRLDTIERLDPRSLQHHGSYALSLARGFGNLDLSDLPAKPPQVYFSLPFLGLVVYSTRWATPLAALAVLLAAAVLYRGFAGRRLKLGPTVLATLVVPVVWVVTAVAVSLLASSIAGLGTAMSPLVFRWGLVLVSLAVTVALLALAGKGLGPVHLTAASALWWLLLAVATALYQPSSSYLMIWPVLSGLLALHLLAGAHVAKRLSSGTWVALLLLAVPAVVLWVPLISLVGAAFATQPGPILGLLTGWAASSLIPQLVCIPWGKAPSRMAA